MAGGIDDGYSEGKSVSTVLICGMGMEIVHMDFARTEAITAATLAGKGKTHILIMDDPVDMEPPLKQLAEDFHLHKPLPELKTFAKRLRSANNAERCNYSTKVRRK